MKGEENKWYFKADVLEFYHLDARPEEEDNVSIVYVPTGEILHSFVVER
jgi:hypothetical protein